MRPLLLLCLTAATAAHAAWCPGPVAADPASLRVYISRWHSTDFAGSLSAHPVERRRGGNYLTGAAQWNAACTLSGGRCTDPAQTLPPTPPEQRLWFSWHNGGQAALWTQLSPQQQQAVASPLRWAYWQGSREYERPSENGAFSDDLFRRRSALLADSRTGLPLPVGTPQQHNGISSWHNRRHPQQAAAEHQNGAQSYADFARQQAGRPPILYAAANDGLLHAFSADDNGRERFAYLPAAALGALHQPNRAEHDFSHPQYAHRPFHDSAPQAGDIFHSGRWHTWLAGSLGDGGQALYLLDVSQPEPFSTAAVIAEWTHRPDHPQLRHLGAHNGPAQFARLNSGNWGILFGNGYCAQDAAEAGICRPTAGEAGLFLIEIDRHSGQAELHFLATGAQGSNGIAGVAVLDSNDDHSIDYAYAGDLHGNLWRFDLRADSAQQWVQTRPHRLFQTAPGQPVSTPPLVSRHRQRGAVINFGTGLRQTGHSGQSARYAEAVQSLYGLIDPLDHTAIGAESLLRQTLSGHTLSRRALMPEHRGWWLDLPITERNGRRYYEQVVTASVRHNRQWLLHTHNGEDSRCHALAGGYSYALSTFSGAGIAGFFQADPAQPPERQPHRHSGAPVMMRHGQTDLLLPDPQQAQWQTVRPDAAKRLYRLTWRLL